MEDRGIKTVEEEKRHGKPFNQFTLWFGANITLADFAVGFLPYILNLNIFYTILALIIGTLLGAIVLATVTVLGPKKGKAQMMISEETFGKWNWLMSLFQGISTLGWFIVNLILGTLALLIIFHTNYIFLIIIYGIVQILLAIYGYDYIHKIELIFSILLGIMFLYITITGNFVNLNYNGNTNIYYFGIVLATSFAYIASWAPYGSDYSRYLPQNTSSRKVFIYSFLGSFLSTIWLEILGFLVAIKTGNTNSMFAAYSLSGFLGILTVISLFMGGLGTNAVNIYSHSLSVNAIFKNFDRKKLLVISGFIGIILAIIGFNSFYTFYEDFLYFLDYWIMPWFGIIVADQFIVKKGIGKLAIISFLVSLLISVPFMNQAPLYTGPISNLIGGVDISYFVSFALSLFIYTIISRLLKQS